MGALHRGGGVQRVERLFRQDDAGEGGLAFHVAVAVVPRPPEAPADPERGQIVVEDRAEDRLVDVVAVEHQPVARSQQTAQPVVGQQVVRPGLSLGRAGGQRLGGEAPRPDQRQAAREGDEADRGVGRQRLGGQEAAARMAEPDAVRRQEHRRGRRVGDRRRRGCGQVQRLLQPLDSGLAGPGPGGDIGRDGVEIRQHVAAQVAGQRLWPRRPGERRHPARPQRAGRRAVDHRPALAQYLEQDERQARAGQAFAEDRRHVGPRRENVGRKFVVGKDA